MDSMFVLPGRDFEPAYLAMHCRGELLQRAQQAVRLLEHCLVCPRNCGVDRLADRAATCKTGRLARVSSYFPHLGEEDCLRGWNGSGTIFFSLCNLRCVFCQNFDISQSGAGSITPPGRLAEMMLELQAMGCHNINLVTPEHVVPQILEALPLAVEAGLRLPLVYNTSAYDSMESLHLLDGIVDIYMPDFKIWDEALSLRYLKARDYPAAARRAILEMHRQVGELKLDEHGLAKRGVLIRHLVMPGEIAGTEAVMRFIAEQVSPDSYVNVMGQYYPAGKVGPEKYPEIDRRVTAVEVRRAIEAARRAGLWRLDERRPLGLAAAGL
jgi:putative pyruvate formate lyase activating enzyme